VSVRYALLALLSEGPKYGLQLQQEFEAGTGEAWPLNVGQVYTTLQRLDRDGMVESVDGGDEGSQQTYRITETGRAELDAWLQTPPDSNTPPRDELVIKVLVALRVPGANVGEVVQVHRRHLVELMQQYTRLKEDMSDGEVTLGIVVDAELFRLDGVIRWLDAVDSRISRYGTPPPLADPAEPTAPQRLRNRIGDRQ
jgi:DNA-binding PadR family transcriptional regulator